MRVTTMFLLLFAVVVFCTLGDDVSYESADASGSEGEGDKSSLEGEEAGKELDCDQYRQQTCPRNGDPVCGTNNKNYPNECALCLENQKTDKDIEILKYEEC